jgi:hypothetical protein
MDVCYPAAQGLQSERQTTWPQMVVRFPVTFRSKHDGAPFKITAVALAFYLVLPEIGDSVANYPKYLLTGVLMFCFALLAVTRRINLSPLLPLASLLLAALGTISLVYSTFVAPGTTTYSSALIPLIITAMPLLIGHDATQVRSDAVIQYLVAVTCLGALCHVLWQVVSIELGWIESGTFLRTSTSSAWLQAPGHTSTIPIVYLMVLSGLLRRSTLLTLAVVLLSLSVMLRPTSTGVFTALFASGVIILHRLRLRRLLRVFCIVLAVGIVIENLAVLESRSFAEALYSIEPMVKEETFEAQDNTDFRLAVLAAARDEFAKQSVWLGKAFMGDVTVDSLIYLRWYDEAEVTIHSDFVIMVLQGGLLGYGLYAALFIGMARLCMRAARLARAAGDSSSETLFDALQAMNVIFMLYASGNPMMQGLKEALLFQTFVALTIFLARGQQLSKCSAH